MKFGDWFKRFLGADKEQQDVLKRFFKEETTWCPEHVGWQLVAAICLFVSVPVSCFPYQVLMEDWDAIWSVFYAFELMGLLLYMKKYTSFMEDQREKQIYDILEFLPVSGRQLSLFRMGKLMRLCGLFFAFSALSQSFFATVVMHRFSMLNILIPAGLHLFMPLVFPGLPVMLYPGIGAWKKAR